ncbi:MAG: alanine dehydrogenase [Actinobacteria bacterium RBG_16_64_13]|nr:MAG: alanine dehydrogenase [Actinobacteria bacterium RBG_16_64_13]
MIVGVPKEVKNHEYRVSMVPAGVKSLVRNGHTVIVQASAGEGSGISDGEYEAAGATIGPTAEAVFAAAEMIVKVKEPLLQEYPVLREDQVLFTYLHLAPAPELTKALLGRKVIGIAYETVQLENGSLPLLTPMSEVAGKLSIQVGAHWLQKENGGSGVLLAGVPGTPPANVAIIGGGVVGINAAKVALGMGANVTILDVNLDRLRYLADVLQGRLTILASHEVNVEHAVAEADLVIGALLIPGARATKVVTKAMISRMRKGSVIVDVAIDQGGCVEGSVPTTHERPVIDVDGVTLVCVANMPGCVARTSTFALTNATFPYVSKLANLGYRAALKADPALAKGLNVIKGKLVCSAVAESVGIECASVEL